MPRGGTGAGVAAEVQVLILHEAHIGIDDLGLAALPTRAGFRTASSWELVGAPPEDAGPHGVR